MNRRRNVFGPNFCQSVAGKRRTRDIEAEVLDSAEVEENVSVQVGATVRSDNQFKSARPEMLKIGKKFALTLEISSRNLGTLLEMCIVKRKMLGLLRFYNTNYSPETLISFKIKCVRRWSHLYHCKLTYLTSNKHFINIF